MHFRQTLCNLRQGRVLLRFAFEGLFQLAARDQRGLYVQQLLRVEHAAARVKVNRRADITRAANAGSTVVTLLDFNAGGQRA